MQLLRDLCAIHAPSGNELAMKEFVMEYVRKNSTKWKVLPQIITGDEFQDCVLLRFGKPRTVALAHMDSVGFTVRYEDQLVPIGSPDAESGYELVGSDQLGPIECSLDLDRKNRPHYRFGRAIETGTELVFKMHFRETRSYIQSCYLDNRLGVYNLLRQCEWLENGLLAFTCWEEQGGGSVPIVARFAYQELGVSQALISDITWVTEGVRPGKGVAISLRDANIPRRSYIDRITKIASQSGINYQMEVEAHGSSDGRELQYSPYPFDWAFIGAAEQHVHSPNEKVHKKDIDAMVAFYRVLLAEL